MRKLWILNGFLAVLCILLCVVDYWIVKNALLGVYFTGERIEKMDLKEFLMQQDALPNEVRVSPCIRSTILVYDEVTSWWHKYPKVVMLIDGNVIEGGDAVRSSDGARD